MWDGMPTRSGISVKLDGSQVWSAAIIAVLEPASLTLLGLGSQRSDGHARVACRNRLNRAVPAGGLNALVSIDVQVLGARSSPPQSGVSRHSVEKPST
jgi:hypothetical protein